MSSRSPRNDGWRSLPSAVHSVNCTCPTNWGTTQVASRSRGTPSTGDTFTASLDSRSLSSARSFAENPVPTLPANVSLP